MLLRCKTVNDFISVTAFLKFQYVMSSLDLFLNFLHFLLSDVECLRDVCWISCFSSGFIDFFSVPVCTGLGACTLGSVYLPGNFLFVWFACLKCFVGVWKSSALLIVQPFQGSSLSVLIVLFRSSVCSRCGSLVPKCARAGSGLWSSQFWLLCTVRLGFH